jgi:hypothetical protein
MSKKVNNYFFLLDQPFELVGCIRVLDNLFTVSSVKSIGIQ